MTDACTDTHSELQALIDSTSSPSSIFHTSNISKFTDTTVYSPPAQSSSDEPEPKKRKLNGESSNALPAGSGVTLGNDTTKAVYPSLMVSNPHLKKVHETMKRECEQLAELCVS